ncbi:hypothetical protein [Streptomyces sp. SYSU K217416]
MPFTLRRSRRSLLAGAAGAAGAALLAGCSDRAPSDAGGASERARLSAEQRLRERAARDSTQLLAQYDATAAAHPALAARLAPLRAQVAAHAGSFGATPQGTQPPTAPPGAAAAGPSTGPQGTSPAAPAPGAPPPPAEPGQALAALAAAERRIADARAAALLGAPGELARLLASVAAAGAVHAYLLTTGEPK